jgi:hypothetical protein
MSQKASLPVNHSFASSCWKAVMVLTANCESSDFVFSMFSYWMMSAKGQVGSECIRAQIWLTKLISTLTGFLLTFGIKLAGELLNVGQEHLIGFMLLVEFVFKVLSLVDLLQRSPQELIFPLGMFNDFLQQQLG